MQNDDHPLTPQEAAAMGAFVDDAVSPEEALEAESSDEDLRQDHQQTREENDGQG